MNKNWRKTTVGSTAGRSGPDLHRVLIHAAFMAAIIVSLAASAFQSSPAQAQTRTLVLSPTSLAVLQGGTATFTVKLSSTPSGTVTVRINTGRSTNIVALPTTMRFTTNNWNTAQTATVYGARNSQTRDVTENVDLRAAGGGYGSVTGRVVVTLTNTLPTPTPTDTLTHTSTPTDTPTHTSTPTDTPTHTSTPTDIPTHTSTPTDIPTHTSTPTDTPTHTSTPTDTPTHTSTPTDIPTHTSTPTDIPTHTSTPTDIPTHTSTPTDTPTHTPSLGGAPESSDPLPPGSTSEPTNPPTAMPTTSPANTPTPGTGEGSSSGGWVNSGLVQHPATPVQVFWSAGTLQFYFIGPDRTQSGPVVPSVSELAQEYPKGSPVVTLFLGTNPLTGKQVRIDYLPTQQEIMFATVYTDTYYKKDKPYIFTIDKDHEVKHAAW